MSCCKLNPSSRLKITFSTESPIFSLLILRSFYIWKCWPLEIWNDLPKIRQQHRSRTCLWNPNQCSFVFVCLFVFIKWYYTALFKTQHLFSSTLILTPNPIPNSRWAQVFLAPAQWKWFVLFSVPPCFPFPSYHPEISLLTMFLSWKGQSWVGGNEWIRSLAWCGSEAVWLFPAHCRRWQSPGGLWGSCQLGHLLSSLGCLIKATSWP